MARIIVQTDGSDAMTLLDERNVRPVHMEGESAANLMERLAWAIEDAEGRLGQARGRRRRRRGVLSEEHAVAGGTAGPFD